MPITVLHTAVAITSIHAPDLPLSLESPGIFLNFPPRDRTDCADCMHAYMCLVCGGYSVVDDLRRSPRSGKSPGKLHENHLDVAPGAVGCGDQTSSITFPRIRRRTRTESRLNSPQPTGWRCIVHCLQCCSLPRATAAPDSRHTGIPAFLQGSHDALVLFVVTMC
jgi:hypothetical protein